MNLLTREVIKSCRDIFGRVSICRIADYQASFAHRSVTEQDALQQSLLCLPWPGRDGIVWRHRRSHGTSVIHGDWRWKSSQMKEPPLEQDSFSLQWSRMAPVRKRAAAPRVVRCQTDCTTHTATLQFTVQGRAQRVIYIQIGLTNPTQFTSPSGGLTGRRWNKFGTSCLQKYEEFKRLHVLYMHLLEADATDRWVWACKGRSRLVLTNQQWVTYIFILDKTCSDPVRPPDPLYFKASWATGHILVLREKSTTPKDGSYKEYSYDKWRVLHWLGSSSAAFFQRIYCHTEMWVDNVALLWVIREHSKTRGGK